MYARSTVVVAPVAEENGAWGATSGSILSRLAIAPDTRGGYERVVRRGSRP